MHASAGDTRAQLQLGIIYHEGWLYGVDYTEAFRWLVLAATSGSPDAQNKVACLYWQGRGVAASRTKAETWWRSAAAAGVIEAARNLGNMNNPDFKPSFGPLPEMPETSAYQVRRKRFLFTVLTIFAVLFAWGIH